MKSPKPQRRTVTNGGDDAIASLQETLEREEHRRAGLRQFGLIVVALAVVASVGVAVLFLDGASALDKTPVVAGAQEPAVAEPATTSAPLSASPDADETQPRESTKTATSATRKTPTVPTPAPVVSEPSKQRFRIAIGSNGYEPGVVLASTGKPIELEVGRGEGCAAGFLIPALGVDKDNSHEPITVNLGTVPAGRYRFSCGMEMVTGTLIVE